MTVDIPDHVVFRRFPEEMVVLNLQTGLYHGLNGTAGRMFELLAERREVAAAAAVVADEYSAPVDRVRTDIEALVADLENRGLLAVTDG